MLGSVFALALLTIIFFLSIIYLSVFVASFFERKIMSLQFFAFTSVPVFLLSGLPWPIQTMPWFAKQITMLIPTSPYFLAMQRITQMGAGLQDVLPELLQLLILMSVFLLAAYLRMNDLVKKEILN
jgi:ABC-2 type transport system permease protein